MPGGFLLIHGSGFPPSPIRLSWCMSIAAMIFDLDGTLVDTNPTHVEAWRKTFTLQGHDIPESRIAVEIGKGGDKLVPSVLGQAGEAREGDALRRLQKEAFLASAKEQRLRVFPGAREIFGA